MNARTLALTTALCLSALALADAPPPPALDADGGAAMPDAMLTAGLARVAARYAAAPLLQFDRLETTSELDSNDKPKSTQTILFHFTQLSDGGQLTEILNATQDGQDVTKKTKQERELATKGATDKDEVRVTAISPFRPDQQPNYLFKATRWTGPRASIHFQPKGAPSTSLLNGDAQVNLETGEVFSLSAEPTVRPTHVDTMEIGMDFRDAPPGAPPVDMTVTGAGHFLFFHQKMRVTEHCSDFKPAPKPGP